MRRIRCKPGDHFSTDTVIHIPDFFEKVANERIHKKNSGKSIAHQFDRSAFSKSLLYEDSDLVVLNKPSGVCCQVLQNHRMSLLARSEFLRFHHHFTPEPISFLLILSRSPLGQSKARMFSCMASYLGHHRYPYDRKKPRDCPCTKS